jgi:hypothetical protein
LQSFPEVLDRARVFTFALKFIIGWEVLLDEVYVGFVVLLDDVYVGFVVLLGDVYVSCVVVETDIFFTHNT